MEIAKVMHYLHRLAPFAVLWMVVDVNYFVRAFWTIVKTKLTRSRTPPGPFVSSTFWSVCLPMDLDCNRHMNNSRYLRECDFARFQFFLESHLFDVVKKLGGSIVNRGNNIRYRRSILPLDVYKIQTKLLFWDQKNFYIEQQMIRRSDDFVCAVSYVSLAVISKDKSISPQQVIDSMYGKIEDPEAPPEIAAWIKSTEHSSQAFFRNTQI
ncbi:hypothetical protein V1264_003824 [Littorina saxatilis]|uniref:Protein THEM6 n=1 Tax=Littorina saxatilis TaxID=31220 RepID=A0AAN9B0E7_9CAEN